MKRYSKAFLGASLLLLCGSTHRPAHAEKGDVEAGFELGLGLPILGYLTPPGKNDRHARVGALGLMNLGLALNNSWNFELLLGAGYLAEFSRRSNEPGDWIGQFSAGPKWRLGDEKRWWLSAHVGAYQFDGTQFGMDAGVGYDFGTDAWRMGPLLRSQLTFAGNEDPQWPDESQPDAAIWFGFAIRHLGGTRQAQEQDLDGDALVGNADRCPQDAEDRDNYQDEDGCPDPDNDYDGRADVVDKCPVDPEDIDGYQDEDGCPDLDNDGDGIPDDADSCPLKAEDKDGIEDNDGCPEAD